MIFIASGSYLIGEDLATLNNVPLLEIKAKRVGGKAKKYLSFVLKLIPRKLKIYLRKKKLIVKNTRKIQREMYHLMKIYGKNIKNVKIYYL